MPKAPKYPCQRCKHVRCTCTEPPTKTRGERLLPRPQYKTSAERKRRAAAVSAFLDEHGFLLASGDLAARCPECRHVRAKWVADHVLSIADGGREDGELTVHCRSCSGKQGARIAAQRRGAE